MPAPSLCRFRAEGGGHGWRRLDRRHAPDALRERQGQRAAAGAHIENAGGPGGLGVVTRPDAGATAERVPLAQVFLDNIFLLLVLGLAVPIVFYTIWGLLDAPTHATRPTCAADE